jgi:AbrB family looped-hinge helix DNA binding protein
MENVYHTKLGEGRRIAIPAEVCDQLGLRPGAPLAITIEADGLHVVPYEQIIREVQAAFAPYRQPGVSAVDELIQERRDEAVREERELQESGRANDGKTRE